MLELWSSWPHGAANPASEAVTVAAIGPHVVTGVAIESATEVVESVRDSVCRHWLWQNSG